MSENANVQRLVEAAQMALDWFEQVSTAPRVQNALRDAIEQATGERPPERRKTTLTRSEATRND